MTAHEKQKQEAGHEDAASASRADATPASFQQRALELEAWQHAHHMKMAALSAEIAAIGASQDGDDAGKIQALEAERQRLSLALRTGGDVFLTRHTLRELIGTTGLEQER